MFNSVFPGSKTNSAHLVIKWVVGDVQCTRSGKHARRTPENVAIARHIHWEQSIKLFSVEGPNTEKYYYYYLFIYKAQI